MFYNERNGEVGRENGVLGLRGDVRPVVGRMVRAWGLAAVFAAASLVSGGCRQLNRLLDGDEESVVPRAMLVNHYTGTWVGSYATNHYPSGVPVTVWVLDYDPDDASVEVNDSGGLDGNSTSTLTGSIGADGVLRVSGASRDSDCPGTFSMELRRDDAKDLSIELAVSGDNCLGHHEGVGLLGPQS